MNSYDVFARVERVCNHQSRKGATKQLARFALAAFTSALLLMPSTLAAAEADAKPSPNTQGPEYVEVTATRIPEDPIEVPASVTIVSGQDLRNRGIRDLRGALSLVAGIDIAPGGDGGPASSVPEIWGLREFDAFLLVVDGVPWGGAFNPALATLDLSNVDRIEVVRGAAPVLYGATSFVGVIHVLRLQPGHGTNEARASFGSFGSGSLSARILLPEPRGFTSLTSSLDVDLQRVGFKDDRTQFDRGHVLWRGATPALGGQAHLDLEGSWLQQDPASPHPREGESLSSATPLDANHNLRDAHLNERRLFLNAGYTHRLGPASWATTLAFTDSSESVLRGFLTDISNTDPNANGFRQGIEITDVYFDSHLEFTQVRSIRLVAGLDHLYGRGRMAGGDFDYFVNLDGHGAPKGDDIDVAGEFHVRDIRNFSGAYSHFEWTPIRALRFDVGARLNRTAERRTAREIEIDTGDGESGGDSRSTTRGSGAAGVTWTPWETKENTLRVWGGYRNTYKPAAIDFGPEAEPEILDPERAVSYEAGVKGRFNDGAIEAELSGFQMDFENLVVAKSVNGLPGLENAGKSRFRGLEADVEWKLQEALYARTNFSIHDARFRDFVTEFDPGVPTQLAGNRQEMTPRYLAGAGIVYARDHGWIGSVDVDWAGSRFLNKRNTAKVPAYTTWSAGVGYRSGRWEVRVDGTNLNNQRPPVSESELGDAQYYRLPARRITLSGRTTF